MVSMNNNLRNSSKIGVDMEDAIFERAKNIFPDAKQLHCLRHLGQRDEEKLNKFLAQTKCKENIKT